MQVLFFIFSKFFPSPARESSPGISRGCSLPVTQERAQAMVRVLAAAAAVVAAVAAAIIPATTVVAAATAAATPAVIPTAAVRTTAAAEDDDQDQNDPQAASAAPAVIAAPHNEYLLIYELRGRLNAALNPILCGGTTKVCHRYFSAKFCSMTATWARVALPRGLNVVSVVPVISPAPQAQASAWVA